MSTWTSRLRVGAALFAAPVLLAGCIAEGVLPFPALGTPQPASAPAEPRVLADSVVVAAPEGWCPDPRAGLEGEAGSFLLIGPCRTGPVPPVPAILTLSVLGTAGTGAMDRDRLDAFFGSEVGRAALSRAGDAATVRVVQGGLEGEAYVLHVRDTAPMPGGAVAPDAWRAVLPLSGRLVALTVLSPAEPAVPPATLRSVLDAFVAAMRAANGASPATDG